MLKLLYSAIPVDPIILATKPLPLSTDCSRFIGARIRKIYLENQKMKITDIQLHPPQIGLAWLRQDGLVSFEAGNDEGIFETTPEGLNDDTPVPGCALADSDHFNVDSICHSLRWEGGDR